MLTLEHVSKVFAGRRGMFGTSQPVAALNDVSLSVARGESFGLVGESGSGTASWKSRIWSSSRVGAERTAFKRTVPAVSPIRLKNAISSAVNARAFSNFMD